MGNFKISDMIDVFNFISKFFNIYYSYYREDRNMMDINRFLSFEQENKVYSPDNVSEEYFKGIFGDHIPEDSCSKIYEFRYNKENIREMRTYGSDSEVTETRDHVFYKKKIFIIISDTDTFNLAARRAIFSDVPDEIYITIPSNFRELSEIQKYNRCMDIFTFILSENIGIRSIKCGNISGILAGLIFGPEDKDIKQAAESLKRDIIRKDSNFYIIDKSQQFIFKQVLKSYLYI